MNRKFAAFVVASLFVLATLCGFAAAEGVEDQIKKLEMGRASAVVKGDMATLDKQTADDYTLININGQVSDKSQMLNSFKTGQSKLTKDDVSEMKVRVYGDVAVITGKVSVAGMMGGKDVTGDARFTRIYVQQGGQWKSVALQQTRVPAP